MCTNSIFTCILVMISNFSILFTVSIFIFKLFPTNLADIVDIEKPDVVCSPTSVADNFPGWTLH